jgi:hypothetical protein
MCFFNSFNSFFLTQGLPKVGTESKANLLQRAKNSLLRKKYMNTILLQSVQDQLLQSISDNN